MLSRVGFWVATVTGLRSILASGLATSRASARASGRAFRRSEDGALVIFALMLAVLMLMMGGIAVDLMRYESRRTSLQNTLDRSTLAAAALNQAINPRKVVDDYFLKAGLMSYLTSVTVTQGLNYRQVTATAEADTKPLFLGMMGIDKFDAPGLSQAEQRVNNVEVMMVLDVSGSMNSNSRLTNLKTAATQFVSTVLSNDAEEKISIGMVPFNGQVNLSQTLLNQFSTVNPSGTTDVNCVDLPTTAYNNLTLSQYAPATSVSPEALSMTADADAYDGSGVVTPNPANKWCPPLPENQVRLPGRDIGVLQGQINALTGIGATSINAGLKWGLGLLDPSARPIYNNLIAAGAIPANLNGRPYEYDDKEAMKVIVLMTDGEHFAESRVNDTRKAGLSMIYKGNSDGNYSIFHASRVTNTNATTICNSRPYYVHHLSAWQSRAWNGTNPGNSDCYVPANQTNPNGATQQTWPQVWSARNLQYVTCTWLTAPLGQSCSGTTYNNLLDTYRSVTATTTMDTQLQAICTLAKARNVIIYGIAFEAPTNGQTQIRNCSTDGTTGSHYFNASGLQISTAFNAIANNISQLRLTQ